MPSSLEKLVVPEVDATLKAKKEKEDAERKEEARRQKYAPKDRAELMTISYPSICDGEHRIYFDAGHWRLEFKVGGETFEIHDEYIPADSGTPTEGYPGHDAYWQPYLYLSNPNVLQVSFCSVWQVESDTVINMRDPKRPAKDRKSTKDWVDKQIKETGEKIANAVKDHLLKKDDWSYRQRLDNCRRRY